MTRASTVLSFISEIDKAITFRTSKFQYFTIFLLICLTTLTHEVFCHVNISDELNIKVEFSNATISFSAVNLDDGESIIDFNGDAMQIPASTLKVITLLTAIDLLGEDFQFKTKIDVVGEILPDGTLDGNIVIRGSGDPTLGSPKIGEALSIEDINQHIFTFLVKKNIHCINGSLVIDNTLFSSSAVHPTWQWNDLSNYYAAGSWAFNIHDNYFDLYFERDSKPNSWTEVESIFPVIEKLNIFSTVKTGSMNSGDNAYFYSHPLSQNIAVNGTIPPGNGRFKIKGAIPNPSEFYKDQFFNFLEEKGIVIHSTPHVRPNPKPNLLHKTIGAILSPALSHIVAKALFDSNNMYCESIAKTLGANFGNKGDINSGVKVIQGHIYDNLTSKSIHMVDGSGLSMHNRMSTNFMAEFLSALYRKNGKDFISNHLYNIDQKDRYEKYGFDEWGGKLYIKSGSMSNVFSYCGVYLSENKKIAFAFISNGHMKSNSAMRDHLFKTILPRYITDNSVK